VLRCFDYDDTTHTLSTNASNNSDMTWQATGNTPNVYRFWSPKNQHHFYTANYNEAFQVMTSYPDDIWTYEGVAYKATAAGSCASGETPVYRFWSDKNSSHFFTNNPAEKDSIIANYPTNIWRYEGEAFCAKPSASSGYKPVYRFWSDKLSGHFFTTNAAERDSIIANYPTNVWRYEGVAYYVQ
jgi:lysyl endopeptidase